MSSGTAGTAAHSGVIDIKPDVGGKVWFRCRGKGLRDIGGQVAVDEDVGLLRCRIGNLIAGRAAEGNSWDAFFGSFSSSPNGARDLDCAPQVGYLVSVLASENGWY